MKSIQEIVLSASLVVVGCRSALAQNLLVNGDFESLPAVPNCAPDEPQSCLPQGWYRVSVTPDTYSNDGSYGYLPSFGGNFPDTVAQNGIRFVAAWSFSVGCGGPLAQAGCGVPGGSRFMESFAQTLAEPLSEGTAYRISAHLRLGPSSCQNRPGTYDVYLTDVPASAGQNCVRLGSFEAIAEVGVWRARTFTFTAPGSAGARAVVFVPRAADEAEAQSYVAIDNVWLTRYCAADFNGDGSADFFDYLDFAALLDAEDPAADFNGDQNVDFFDYLDFVAALDAGCE